MRGRLQATGVCIACGILPFAWLATAVVALVLLRKGVQEGALLLLWTSLPLAAWFMISPDPSTVLALVGTFGLALILRLTRSWEWVLVGAVVEAAIAAFVWEYAAPDLLDRWAVWFVDNVQQDISEDQLRQLLPGFFAMGQAYAMIICLVLARWWQSLLYNPGGFRREFHHLRLPPALSWSLVALTVLLLATREPAFLRWIPLLTVPLIVAAIGLVHWIASEKKLSVSWLVVFYVLLFGLIQVIYPLMAALALIDSWIDLRRRIESGKHEDEV